MQSCSTCIHWRREEYRPVPALGKCTKVIQLWDATEWCREEGPDAYTERKVMDEYSEQLSFVQDASDYQADLYTRSIFFCAHWETVP